MSCMMSVLTALIHDILADAGAYYDEEEAEELAGSKIPAYQPPRARPASPSQATSPRSRPGSAMVSSYRTGFKPDDVCTGSLSLSQLWLSVRKTSSAACLTLSILPNCCCFFCCSHDDITPRCLASELGNAACLACSKQPA